MPLTLTQERPGANPAGSLADRRARYTRAALVLLGYGPTEIRAFQRAEDIAADGIAGPTTRATLHAALTVRPLLTFKEL